MRRRILTLLFVAMTAVTVLVPADAGANSGASVLIEKSRNAVAYYHATNGCLEAWLYIHAGLDSGMSNDDQPNRQDSIVLISALGYDACLDEILFSIEDYPSDLTIDIATGLNRASLSGSTTVPDFYNDVDLPVTLDLSWQAIERRYHDHDALRVELPYPNGGTLTMRLHAQALWRNAESGGTIAIGERVFQVAASVEHFHAELFSFNAGQVVLER